LALTVFLGFMSIQPLRAQDKLLPVFQFKRVDGISEQVRSRAVRDEEGFVWIGTARGLERFDGYGVRSYRNIPDDPHSLSSNTVTSLLLDTKKRLWVGTDGNGLSLYDRANDRFLNFLPRAGDTSWYQAKTIARILEDRNGALWLATRYGGVVRIDLPSDAGPENLDTPLSRARFTTYDLSTPLNSATDLIERTDGKILVASDSGLIAFDPSTHSLPRLNIAASPGHLLTSLAVQCFCRDSNDVLWVGTETKGLFRVDWIHHTVQNYRHARGDILSVISDDIHDVAVGESGALWLGTDAGLQLFSPSSGQDIPYLTIGPVHRGPSLMTMISVDRAGTLWIGTAEGGVQWLSPKSRLIPLFGLPDASGPWPRDFDTIDRDRKGNLWLTSAGLAFQIDITSKKVLKVIDIYRGKKPTFGDCASFIDKRGTLWFGTCGLGLFRVDLESGRVRNYGVESGLGASRIVIGITQATGDSLWIAAHYDGLKKFDPITGRFSGVPGMSKIEVRSVMQDRQGTVWVASPSSGISILNPSTGAVEAFRHSPSDPTSLSSDNAPTVFQDFLGRLWVGAGNVIHLWNPTARTFTRYPNPAFGAGCTAWRLHTDAKGRLWGYFHNGGLSMLDLSSGAYTDFDPSCGLCGGVNGMTNLEDGRMVLGGWWGLNVFHPDSLDKHQPAPPLVLTKMSINDEPVAPPQLNMASSSLSLPYSQNVLEFEFAAIDINAPLLVQYQYLLEGLEKDWVKPKQGRFVRYTNLAPGDYTFRVRAASSRSEWPDREIALLISISPPWWRTLWAYGGYGLFFLGLIYSGYRLRLKQVKLKQQAETEHFQSEHLAEVDRLKSRFFSNISHEFRTPLTLILGPADQAIETAEQPLTQQKLRVIKENAVKLFALVNQLLDFSRLESGMMRLQVSYGDLVQFVRRVVMSFESWAERKKINLEFQSDAGSAGGFFDRDKLEKIVNNLMSNALKFTTEGGTVKVWLHLEPNTARSTISVADTGSGIAPEHLPHIFDRFYRVDETHTTEGTGIGLALTKELVELHHGTIAVKSTPGKGSVFTVVLPVEKGAYRADEISETPSQPEERAHIEAPAVESRSELSMPPADGKPIVLVVEDNVDLRDYIREFLEADYAVHEAGNGKEGLDKALELVPDLVISDVMMPEMDGMELCQALKQDVLTSHVPVILLTARAGMDSKIEGLETGADDYVTKPFESKELLARVRNLIEQRRQLRAKFSAGLVLKPGEVAVTSVDDALLKKVMEIVERNMENEEFAVDDLAREACLSRTHLNRKLRGLTNLSPAEFIRYIRLQRARELLEKNVGPVAEIAFRVGFTSPAYFSACFHERFGYPPSEVYRRS
jgi:signal transduction histidine kinase/DNA-binding response OmpR family regulator/ligand-binding sensor domain-containing protein